MATTINADTAIGGAVVTGDASGVLALQAAGSTQVTINGSGVVLANPLPVASGGTGGSATPTAGGVVYGTGTVQAVTAAGTSGQLLQSNGASAPSWVTASAGALTFITSVTASNSATVDIENAMTAYNVYVIEAVNIVNATDDTFLKIQLKIGGSYITTSTYLYATATNYATGGTVAVDNAATVTTFIKFVPHVSSSTSRTANGSIKIFNPSSTTIEKQISFNYSLLDATGYTGTIGNGFGNGTNSGTGAVTGVRIFSSSGNITSGTFRLYGIANS